MKIQIAVLATIIYVGGCAHDVMARHDPPWTPAADAGSVTIRLSGPVSRVSVVIDDRVVVDQENTAFISIGGIPPGIHNLHVVGTDPSLEAPVNHIAAIVLQPGENHDVLIAVPPTSAAWYAFVVIPAAIVGILIPVLAR